MTHPSTWTLKVNKNVMDFHYSGRSSLVLWYNHVRKTIKRRNKFSRDSPIRAISSTLFDRPTSMNASNMVISFYIVKIQVVHPSMQYLPLRTTWIQTSMHQTCCSFHWHISNNRFNSYYFLKIWKCFERNSLQGQ